MIDKSIIDKILAATDIKDVVSEFVNLKRSGNSYKGLCPFHQEDTPSFFVWPKTGTWHCFGCGEGGDVISFLQKQLGLSYLDVIRWLGKRYGIEVVERTLSDKEVQKQKLREAMYAVNEFADKFYSSFLETDEGQTAREYLKARGIAPETAQTFHLGYAPKDNLLLGRQALSGGYSDTALLGSGLAYKNRKQELADRFSGRLIFPWIDHYGHVVAFGGRKIVSGTKGIEQKYINSKESEIYHKGHELYGIWQALDSIQKKDFVYLVEGYIDVISMHQAGIHQVVANSGTALSPYQVDLLHRFTRNIILIYDGDEAGQKGMERSSKLLLQGDMNVSIVILPDGHDPDSFIQQHGADAFRDYLTRHMQDVILYQMDHQLHPDALPAVYSRELTDILEKIACVQHPVLRAVYLQKLAERTRIEQTVLHQLLKETK